MTIPTTPTDLAGEGKSEATIEHPIASKSQPTQGSPEPDLESRIKQRRIELVVKLGQLRRDVRIEAAENRDRLTAALSDLAHILTWGIVDDWASVRDPVAQRLEEWLADSTRHLATKQVRP